MVQTEYVTFGAAMIRASICRLECSGLVLRDYDWQFRDMAHANSEQREIVFGVLTFLDKLHVESLSHHCDNNFQNALCKCFSKANPFAAVER